MYPLVMSIEVLLVGAGGLVAAIIGFFKLKADRAEKAKVIAEGREEAAAGALQRNEAAHTAGEIIRKKADEDRRAREVEDARLEAGKVATSQAWDAERRRTDEAASRGPEAMTERANAAIREGKLPRGKPQ